MSSHIGDESQSLLCSETFTSPTPPSDDCGWTQPGTSVIWSHCENSSQETAVRNLSKSLLSNAVKSHGPLSNVQFHSKIGKGDKGVLLKAALLGETIKSDTNLDTENLKRDINSNFQNKCADDKLKFGGNDVDSGWRMSGSNGYDRNRMTGSSTGGTNNNLSLLSDGSSTQSHTQPQVATTEGMLLGRIGGTGGVALHDIGSRSIVAGTAGAGPQVTLASVFRPPQSVPESGRYGTPFTTAAGSSAVGPYSPLYATGSHGTGLAPYSAFYSQYPGYNTGVMHGTLDQQYGSYSAVLQSMGSHAAQTQVPRSPYGNSGGSGGASGVLGQYSLHMPRTTSPGSKTFIANTNLGTHERDDSKYRREVELEKRRYSTGVLKDEKAHHFPVPSGFPEPARVTFSSTLRESPSQGRDPQDYYKIGREGSLKHRILRPSDSTSSVPLGNPQHSAFTNTDEPVAKRTKSENLGGDKLDFNRQGLQTTESSQPGSEMSHGRTPHLHYPPHFMKGSIIQLGNGEYKRVEDLETDDFRHSADASSDLKIDSSTVVHIDENEAQGTAVLGFVVGEHKIQVRVEATVEHPFFVFGQGWSSCEPTWTMKRYGLECHKLSVGDVCISLTHKEVTAHAAEISQQQKQQSLEDTYAFEKDQKQSESVQQIQRDSPGQGHRNRSPANSQSPTIQGQGYRSDSGQFSESSTAPVKGEHLFGSSQIPSSSHTQEQRSLPSTTSS
ncbi:uncharacterized protein LOC132756338 isoform X2 [Ruditapes philippinarum]|uniref:uncharacterized protein LOC132756338 isoform X2 n=1 Tax=Ruditapes philippinarum TaxID=129788 RepID=UPI00295C1DC0|nr:uncharacterized protein LOC132756338 isoform X2 [Ruditapes philippinarum]